MPAVAHAAWLGPTWRSRWRTPSASPRSASPSAVPRLAGRVPPAAEVVPAGR